MKNINNLVYVVVLRKRKKVGEKKGGNCGKLRSNSLICMFQIKVNHSEKFLLLVEVEGQVSW